MAPVAAGPRVVPLSAAQEPLWYVEQLSDLGLYNVPGAVRVRGAFDAGALLDAVNGVIARHEGLQSRIRVEGGVPVQDVLPVNRLEVTRVDAAGAEVAAVRAEVAAFASARLNLSARPPIDVKVWRLAADDHVVAWVLHHTAADGWSAGALFLREVGELYAAASARRARAR